MEFVHLGNISSKMNKKPNKKININDIQRFYAYQRRFLLIFVMQCAKIILQTDVIPLLQLWTGNVRGIG